MTNYVNGQFVGQNKDPITGTQGPDIIYTYDAAVPNIYAKAGNDIVMRLLENLEISQTTMDGGSGIDTVIYDSPASGFSFTAEGQVFSISSLTQGDLSEADELISFERLKFTDTNIAIDLDGNAGKTAKLLGAVLGAEGVSNKAYVGAGLYLLDDGMTYEEMMQVALEVVLGANPSSSSVVDLLWTNIIGPPTPADNLPQYSALIDNGTYTAAGLAVAAADHSLNTTNIDLIGLSTLGIEYIPYG